VGQADLAQNADLAHAVLDGTPLAAGEALALLDNNAFSTAAAVLAVADAARLLDALETAGALDLEAFAANVAMLHPAIDAVRPFEGLVHSRRRLARLLKGSFLWRVGAARNLQDPLTVRGMPQLFGAARDALSFVRRTLEVELRSADGNPLVVASEGRVVSVWNGETPVAAALDFLRIALAPVLTSANERIVKLLQAPHSGLPDGLAARDGLHEDALAELGVAAQSLAAEARLLAPPVSFELASTTQAEGIEDRTTMAPLAARRLAEMVGLGERLAAIELVVAAQAVDLRGKRLGVGTRRAYAAVRTCVPFVAEGGSVPSDLDPVRDIVRSGFFDDQGAARRRGR
jgi:histidine ammonia-lyase